MPILALGVPQLNAVVMTKHKKTWRSLLAASAVLLSTACSSSVKLGPQAFAGFEPDETVDLRQVQVAYRQAAAGAVARSTTGAQPIHSPSALG